jgi:hypothetical protein
MPFRLYFSVISVVTFVSTVVAMTGGLFWLMTDEKFGVARDLAMWGCRNLPGFQSAHDEWIALLSVFRTMWRSLSPRPGKWG